MRKNFFLTSILLFLAANFGGFAGTASAEPSLSAYDEFVIEVDMTSLSSGEGDAKTPPTVGPSKFKVTVLRDHLDWRKFYYIPPQPRIGTVDRGEDGELPEFMLMRYQFSDPSAKGGLAEGGVLQFSVQLALQDGAMQLMRDAIYGQLGTRDNEYLKYAQILIAQAKLDITALEKEIENEGNKKKLADLKKSLAEAEKMKQEGEARVALDAQIGADQIQISPIPISKSKISFFSPDDGTFIKKSSNPNQVGPTYSTQKSTQTMTLSRNGTAVFDALLFSPTGLNCVYEIEHVGMTPSAGFTVIMNFSKLQDLFVKDKNYSYMEGFSHVGWTETIQKNDSNKELYNRLQDSGALVVETTLDDDIIDSKELLKMQEQALSDMKDKLFPDGHSIEKIDPKAGYAKPADAKISGRDSLTITNTSTFKALVSENKVFRTEYTVRKRIKRTTVFGGFIGIGNWVRDSAHAGWTTSESGKPSITELGDNELQRLGLLAYAKDTGFEFLNLALPPVEPFDGLTSVSHQIELLQKGSPVVIEGASSRLLTWRPNANRTSGSWTNARGDVATNVVIPLGALGFSGSLSDIAIRRQTTLTTGNTSLALSPSTNTLQPGEMPNDSPLDNLGVINVDAAGLYGYFEADTLTVGEENGYINRCTVYLRVNGESLPQKTWRRTRGKEPEDLETPFTNRFDRSNIGGKRFKSGAPYEIAIKFNVRLGGKTRDIWLPAGTTSPSNITYMKTSEETFYIDPPE